MSAIFYQIFISHQIIALQKLWKIFFISSKILFLFSRYSDFSICLLLFFPFSAILSHCFRGWPKINLIDLKVYDVINYVNNNLITHFVWYLEKEKRYEIETLSIDIELIRNIFTKKSCRKCASKASPKPLFNFGK